MSLMTPVDLIFWSCVDPADRPAAYEEEEDSENFDEDEEHLDDSETDFDFEID